MWSWRGWGPVVRDAPAMSHPQVFPGEHERIVADARGLDPQWVTARLMRLEARRVRLVRCYTRARSSRRAESVEGALRLCEWEVNWLLMVRQQQRGVLDAEALGVGGPDWWTRWVR